MSPSPTTAMIVNDVQGEFYDPRAFEVMLQIGEHIKPHILAVNGDWVDWPGMSLKYNERHKTGRFNKDFKESVELSRKCLAEMVQRVQAPHGVAQKRLWNDGNHEWRLFRTLHAIPQVAEILKLDAIRVATSTASILRIEAHGFRYAGEYPAGQWLYGTGNPVSDVWLEHGYISRKNAGYAATGMRNDRMTNFVMGHVERLALSYKHVVGGRNLFAIEGGNLNILGVPKKGNCLYSSAPFNIADYADRQQGFTVITKVGNELFPEIIPIVNGKAVYGGKVFRA